MKVAIKSFDVEMHVKNNGIELDVSDNDGVHEGDLIVTKTSLIWCKGRTSRENGVKVPWHKFTKWMEKQG